MRAIAPLLFLAAPLAAECPQAPDHSVALDSLFAEIQAASSQVEGLTLGQKLWQYWADAPDDVAQDILDRGMARLAGSDFLGAIAYFDRLIAYCPDYAEGYNQRAFAYFLSRNYEAALPDLDRAIELSPRHTGALTGRAMTLIALERYLEAQRDLRFALELNPWLNERRFLMELGEEL